MQRRMLWTAALAGALGLVVGIAVARTPYPPLEVLLQGNRTVLDQAIAYPAGVPEVTGAIVTMAPGQATGWHRHDAPLFAWVMEGEITVDYGSHGTRRYAAGDALLEAVGVAHDGTNTGDVPTRILVVFMGAEGVANTTTVDGPE
ncbi:MAG: cupin domain-containing protein [Geminicoccaceae bacterium]